MATIFGKVVRLELVPPVVTSEEQPIRSVSTSDYFLTVTARGGKKRFEVMRKVFGIAPKKHYVKHRRRTTKRKGIKA